MSNNYTTRLSHWRPASNLTRLDAGQLLAVLLVGVAFKLYIFRDVAVNGDSGLYLYDAKQILWGRDIFVDFPSRSPLMEYLLAGVVWISDSPIVGARSFMILISVLVAAACYAVGRELVDHRVGLVAAALYLLTPFSLVWGLWVKTEPVAALPMLVAAYGVLRLADADQPAYRWVAAIGVLFGLAFFIRRAVIVHLGATVLFWLWYRHRNGYPLKQTISTLAVAGVAALATCGAVYAGLAGFDPWGSVEMFRVHGWALFASDGQGSIGWIGLGDTGVAAEDTRHGWFYMLCQKCGDRTLQVFARTTAVTLPASIGLLGALRSFVYDDSPWLGDTAMPVSLATLAAFGAVNSALGGRPDYALVTLVLLAAVGVVWLGDPVPWERLANPRLVLPVLVLGLLAAGYLYRERILYVAYFQEFMPWLAIVSAVALVAVADANWARRWLVGAGVGVLVVAGLVGMLFAFPHMPDDVENNEWMTVDRVQDYGEFVDSELSGGERVVTAQPLYVIESDHRIVADFSRRYYAYRLYPDSDKADQTTSRVVAGIEGEDAPIAIVDTNMHGVYNHEPAIRDHINQCYDRDHHAGVEATNGELWRRTEAC